MSTTAQHEVHTSIVERFLEARRLLEQAQKPGHGVPAYTRWVNRRGARHVAAVSYSLGVSPNSVTAASGAVSFIGIVLLVALPRTPGSGIAIAILLAVGYLLDSADGQLARLYGSSSKAGEWLDHVVDAFRSPAIHAAVAMSVLLTTPGLKVLGVVALLYCLVTSGQFLSQILASSLIQGAGRTPARGGKLRSFVLLPTDPGTLCWAFILWGFTDAFSIIYSVLALIAVLHSASSLRRRYRDVARLDVLPEGRRHA